MATKAEMNLCVICAKCAVAVAVSVPPALSEERDPVLVLRGAWEEEHGLHGASPGLVVIQPAAEVSDDG